MSAPVKKSAVAITIATWLLAVLIAVAFDTTDHAQSSNNVAHAILAIDWVLLTCTFGSVAILAAIVNLPIRLSYLTTITVLFGAITWLLFSYDFMLTGFVGVYHTAMIGMVAWTLFVVDVGPKITEWFKR